MNEYEAFVATVAIMMPVFLVLAFRGGRRRNAGAGTADPQQIVALSETARRMERRIESLEMLLDTEVPGWRTRSGMR
jgi:phage shock protein B